MTNTINSAIGNETTYHVVVYGPIIIDFMEWTESLQGACGSIIYRASLLPSFIIFEPI